MPKPELGNSRDISLFCRNLHNYSMYKTLIGDTPTKLNLYEYAVNQINENCFEFIEGDICDEKLLYNIFRKFEFEGVFHLAAESHVDRSIGAALNVLETNIIGTYNLLDIFTKKKSLRSTFGTMLVNSDNTDKATPA